MKSTISVAQAKRRINDKLSHFFGVTPADATNEQYYKAVAMILREMLSEKNSQFRHQAEGQDSKQIYYLCMEFLMGRSLKNNLYNLGLTETFEKALAGFDVKLEQLYDEEPDAGLGNGGLGRLAACYLDGLASDGYQSMGYSIRYEAGIFKQKLVDGWQTELPDFWLPGGEVWLVPREERAQTVSFEGWVDESWDGEYHTVTMRDCNTVIAVPYDMYVSGLGDGVARLRLWAARKPALDMSLFNQGEYIKAMEQSAMAETISKVLYPADNTPEGKSLRLRQQYFLVSASVQDIIHRHLSKYGTLDNLPEKVAIHINDTHPTLAIPELMRIMLDECGYDWDSAWKLVTDTMAYTSSALSYLIQNSPKPIIITGAQKPISMEITDAKTNLLDSLRFAAYPDAHGVTIVFNGKIIAGTRAKKVHSKSFNAFDSINFPVLATIRNNKIVHYVKDSCPCSYPAFYSDINPKVCLVKLIPGMEPDLLPWIGEHYDAVIIESYGVGGLPSAPDRDFLKEVDKLIADGKIVVMTTQVMYEGSDMEVYEVGHVAKERYGLIESYDMTLEATVTKLMWIMAQTHDPQRIKAMFYTTINHDILFQNN